MNFDFATILVLACLVTGGIWLADALLFAPRRKQSAPVSGSTGKESTGGTRGGTDPAAADRAGKEPILVEYSRSFFPVLFIVLLLRSFLVEPFVIPSGSMMPTLLVGDFILVNKFAYGLRWPVLYRKFIGIGEPERGDVIVFRYPPDPTKDYIKRVVGVPGDRVEYSGKVLRVNGEQVPWVPAGTYTGVGAGTTETGSQVALEDLGDKEHRILLNPRRPDLIPGCGYLVPGRPLIVPDGQYFVMGDNRDNSRDSRCWGFVPDENLKGKAFAIWMSWDGKLDRFPPVDWGRIGNRIE